LLSDDGLGIRVVRELKKRLGSGDIAFEEQAVGGLALFDSLVGTDRCIIVDAVVTGTHPPGTVLRFTTTADQKPVILTSSHQIDLSQILALASYLGAHVPREVIVYGIEASDVLTFRDSCTDVVTRAIPALVNIICRDVALDDQAPWTHTGEWQIVRDAFSDRLTTEHL
jgi:hydrogenase maturation protease